MADDVDRIRGQAKQWKAYEHSPGYLARRLYADAWCAAFVWPLYAGAAEPPTQAVFHAIGDNPAEPQLVRTIEETERLSAEYRFFHWHLEFPEVFHVGSGQAGAEGPEGWAGGFSCLVGNPPWERVKLQEREFFAGRDPEIANASNKATRERRIEALARSQNLVDQTLYADYLQAKRQSEGESAILRTSGRYPLNGRGDVNTYAVFAEAVRTLTGPHGRSGAIVPTGIATDATTQHFFKDLVEKGSLVALYDFENRERIFPDVYYRMKFCLLTMSGRAERTRAASFAFFLFDPELIGVSEFSLTPEEITMLNPNTGTCPVFRTRRDAEITLSIYRRVPVLVREADPDGNPWDVSFMRMFDMTNDSHLFRSREQLESAGWSLHGNIFERGPECMLPLYEAKMIGAFDHRAADVRKSATATKRQNQPRYLSDEEHLDASRLPIPMAWVDAKELPSDLPSWLASFVDVTSATNERTVIAAAIPPVAAGNTISLMLAKESTSLIVCMNSFIFDYVARQKITNLHMNFFIVKQLPMLHPKSLREPTDWAPQLSRQEWLRPRILELMYTAYDIKSFARDLNDDGAPFRWDRERRALIKAELDAAFLHLYGIVREDVDFILESFWTVRDRDHVRYGEYRTKRLILEIYDAMRHAIETGVPYQTILNPPPGQGPRHTSVSGKFYE